MSLNLLLESVSALGSLWSGLTAPALCTSSPQVGQNVAYETVQPSTALTGVTAFVDVNVVPMDIERVLASQTVVVEGGWITALGPSSLVRIPPGAVRVDGRGKYLMPGFADMHWHASSRHILWRTSGTLASRPV
jgi:hypothetical protein